MSSQGGNQYKSLLSNTLLFGLSTFGSKVLVFLLTRLYTSLLTTEQMSTAELITSTCNFILPIMYLSVSEAIIRFGMESSYKKRDIFSIGIYTVLLGYGLLWIFYPLLNRIEVINDYTYLVYLYVLTSALRTVITNFVRSTGFVRLFAFDGIFTTGMTIAFNLLFLVQFKLGIVGYVLSTICADGLSALCLFFLLRLYRFLHIRGIARDTMREMFRYCLPMIPTAIFWWITNLSDRYFVAYLKGPHINGLYTLAYRIPNLITIVSAFFTQAWQLSAFSEYKSPQGERFYSNVFRSYYTFIFLVASGLILLIKPITTALMAPEYYVSWKYGPFLILAVSFSCLVTFLGAIYNAAKKNAMVSVTTFIGAAINIFFNALLIPSFGGLGAAFATFLSFFVVFVIRAIDTRKYVKIHMQPWRIASSLTLLLLQTMVALGEKPFWLLWEILIFGLLVLCNFGYILFVLRHVLRLLRNKRAAHS